MIDPEITEMRPPALDILSEMDEADEQAEDLAEGYELEAYAKPDGSLAIWSPVLNVSIPDHGGFPPTIEDSIRETICELQGASSDLAVEDLKAWRETLGRLISVVDGALALAGRPRAYTLGSA